MRSSSSSARSASCRSAAITLLPLVLALGVAACGDDGASGTGGGGGTAADGGGGASTGDSGTTSATTGETVSSTASGGTCTPADGDTCEVCMADACCDSWTACEADPLCWACVTGTDGTGCDANAETHARVTAYLECLGGPCNEDCIGSSGECTEAVEVFDDACGACLETSCCEEVGACFAHEGCWVDCVTEHDSEGCHEPTAHALFYAMGSCVQDACAAECSAEPLELACEGVPAEPPSAGACVTLGGGVECNPVTNEGCDAEGAACDTSDEGFSCYPPPNDQALCAACGEADGFCAPGHLCAGGACARYCCTDDDCGAEGVCDMEVVEGVGVCLLAG